MITQVCLELNRTTSTPESSQTDSDDVSPQIQRKRRSGHSRDILPRFSISVEDDHSSLETCTSSSENNRDLSPVNRSQVPSTTPVNKHRSRSVIKSASASGLSLMIPSGETYFFYRLDEKTTVAFVFQMTFKLALQGFIRREAADQAQPVRVTPRRVANFLLWSRALSLPLLFAGDQKGLDSPCTQFGSTTGIQISTPCTTWLWPWMRGVRLSKPGCGRLI